MIANLAGRRFGRLTVGRILGHSSAATTERYAHLDTRTLHKAMGRVK